MMLSAADNHSHSHHHQEEVPPPPPPPPEPLPPGTPVHNLLNDAAESVQRHRAQQREHVMQLKKMKQESRAQEAEASLLMQYRAALLDFKTMKMQMEGLVSSARAAFAAVLVDDHAVPANTDIKCAADAVSAVLSQAKDVPAPQAIEACNTCGAALGHEGGAMRISIAPQNNSSSSSNCACALECLCTQNQGGGARALPICAGCWKKHAVDELEANCKARLTGSGPDALCGVTCPGCGGKVCGMRVVEARVVDAAAVALYNDDGGAMSGVFDDDGGAAAAAGYHHHHTSDLGSLLYNIDIGSGLLSDMSASNGDFDFGFGAGGASSAGICSSPPATAPQVDIFPETGGFGLLSSSDGGGDAFGAQPLFREPATVGSFPIHTPTAAPQLSGAGGAEEYEEGEGEEEEEEEEERGAADDSAISRADLDVQHVLERQPCMCKQLRIGLMRDIIDTLGDNKQLLRCIQDTVVNAGVRKKRSARASGASSPGLKRKCSICKRQGHYAPRCPDRNVLSLNVPASIRMVGASPGRSSSSSASASAAIED
jgi:hypothetical protein